MALNRYLFQEQGFRGNTEEYYDPRNSYLNEVLDRRTGIPITLSTVYMEVARRAGLEVEGVGLPGHFVVRIQTPGTAAPRRPVPRRDAAHREGLPGAPRPDLRRQGEARAEDARALPAPGHARAHAAQPEGHLPSGPGRARARCAWWTCSSAIQPGSAEDLRDRGVLYAALDCYGLAARDLESYLALAPKAPDAEELAARVARAAAQGGTSQLIRRRRQS